MQLGVPLLELLYFKMKEEGWKQRVNGLGMDGAGNELTETKDVWKSLKKTQ